MYTVSKIQNNKSNNRKLRSCIPHLHAEGKRKPLENKGAKWPWIIGVMWLSPLPLRDTF